ncbi:hypothetical protein BX616_004296 [Lobosporangium transversale]|nr:hypothetical protein BX616_004296 [Lobosporangium transversale]
MAPVTDILPFVTPLTDPALTEADFSIAVDNWNESLSRILKHNNKTFWVELLKNDSLVHFLNSFLGEYASFRGNKNDIWVMELQEVVRRTYMIYRRLSDTITAPEAVAAAARLLADQDQDQGQGQNQAQDQDQDIKYGPGSALLDRGIISTSVLMDLSGIYGSSDPEGVSKLVSIFLQNIPDLIGDFRASTGTVVQIIRKVQKRFEKGVSGSAAGKGKGKGKGKGISPSVSPEPYPSEMDEEKFVEIMQYTSALSNIAYALSSVSAVSPTLAIELLQHPTFLQCLTGCYNYTLPVLSKTLIDNQTAGVINPRPVLNFLRIKMLSVVNNILDGIYKQHLVTSTSSPDDESATAELTDSLCGVIVDLYEQSPLQEDMSPMYDAPSILDLEIQFSISEKLSDINVERCRGENDRLGHWIVVLNDLRRFNLATENYVYEHNMRKSEKMAREMSGLYINDDFNRSSANTVSNDSTPRINVTPMTTDQEDDYVKRTMLISQLQDLFPDLGDGFLEACLITFKDNVETVTMRLLEENLPSDLATMDRSTARSMPHRVESAPIPIPVVKSSVVPVQEDILSLRRNIFDGDEFDVFSGKVLDRSKVSRGKKGPKDAEIILDDKSFVDQHKSAILQAVDMMYDDEYDDTYDSMGLNNTSADFKLVDDDIDAKTDEGVPKPSLAIAADPSIEHEEALINMYMGQKDVFNRSTEARRSKKRQELRNLTKMSDEQLEGWAIMFGRNPRKEEIAQKYEFDGRQKEIEGMEPVDKRRGGRLPFVEKSDTQGRPQKQQQQQQFSQKKPQQNKGSHGSKPSSQQPSGSPSARPSNGQQQQQQQSQHQKQQGQGQGSQSNNKSKDNPRDRAQNERQKASKANHNRRNQHAKKMAITNP